MNNSAFLNEAVYEILETVPFNKNYLEKPHGWVEREVLYEIVSDLNQSINWSELCQK